MSAQQPIASSLSPRSLDRPWRERLESDAEQIARRLPARLVDLHSAVVERSQRAGARSLVLSGSTARGSRTGISDLDYHLVGPPIDTGELSRELDLHVLTPAGVTRHLLDGDDFVQWSLRFGLVVFDNGPVREAVSLMDRERLWPDPDRKRAHATKSLDLARRFVATGDEDGALVQVRTALSLAARAHLLASGLFPLSRAELPDQLREIGENQAAEALAETILLAPSMATLERAQEHGEVLLRQ